MSDNEAKDIDLDEEHDLDLPLSSNYDEVKVDHFVLNLSCSIVDKVFEGKLTLFCKLQCSSEFVDTSEKNADESREAVKEDEILSSESPGVFTTNQFICLDCHALDIHSCSLRVVTSQHTQVPKPRQIASKPQLKIPHSCMANYYSTYKACQQLESLPLDFIVHKHWLKIFVPQMIDYSYPFVVDINYKTQPQGQSLMWTVDQSDKPCVFTIGHLLNNRTLFPSQDLPQAMSTWHCSVTLKDADSQSMSVVMTGESEPTETINENGEKVFSSCSSYPIPSSTFALAVGSWLSTDLFTDTHSSSLLPHCRLFSPQSLHEQSVSLISKYLPTCFKVLHSILGPFPLKHLDLLIVPECFDSLGLACPHLMFLSRSLLCPDLSMFARLSHEICHTWFGVLMGPRDWSEEWLTEGICCYLEDMIHSAVMKWDENECRERSELRALLKYKLLKSEISNTPEDLQTLRPHEGLGDSGSCDGQSYGQTFVKHGLNPEKTLMQVHYLKGFFLLKYLEDIAGKETFLETLKKFTNEHLGQLFSSKELLDYFFAHCPNLRCAGLTVDQLCRNWLDSPGMPENLQTFSPDPGNQLVSDVFDEVSFIKAVASRKRSKGQRSRSGVADTTVIKARKMLPEQLVLLLETLVEDEVPVTAAQLKALRDTYNIVGANAEVQHSWCELIIQRRASQWLSDVELFLLHHQALGVYLYGELMISQNKKLQDLAHRCYRKNKIYMPEGPRTSVEAMLFPT